MCPFSESPGSESLTSESLSSESLLSESPSSESLTWSDFGIPGFGNHCVRESPCVGFSYLQNPYLRNPQLRNPWLRNPWFRIPRLRNPWLRNPWLRNFSRIQAPPNQTPLRLPPTKRAQTQANADKTQTFFDFSGKCKVLIFMRIWSFYSHALYILSADDSGRSLQNPREFSQIVGGQNRAR